MNKTTLNILLIILMAMLLGSCTRNHGDIGIWFGTWQVENITIDGKPENVWGNYFFQFQSKVFRVSRVYGYEQLDESFGTWDESEDGHTMTISFPDLDTYYLQMPGLEAHNTFTVTRSSSSDITFTKTDAEGITYTYHLKKQP